MKIIQRLFPVIVAALFLAGCGGEDVSKSGKASTTTGWEYNDPENGGFAVKTAISGTIEKT